MGSGCSGDRSIGNLQRAWKNEQSSTWALAGSGITCSDNRFKASLFLAALRKLGYGKWPPMDCDDRTLRMNPTEMKQHDVCVVGGAGHVGLPLSIIFASKNQRVLIYDLNERSMDVIRGGRMPFMEQGAEPLLREVLSKGLLTFTSRAEDVAGAKTVVITIGTPVDEFLTPSLRVMTRCFDELLPFLSEDH